MRLRPALVRELGKTMAPGLELYALCPATGAVSTGGRELLEVAKGLATSPQWRGMAGAMLIVRTDRVPLIGVVGRFGPADRERLAVLRTQLGEPQPTYLSYADVEADCERLAECLVKRFGIRDLRAHFRYAALPRGGLIVLGMLAYRLGLDRTHLESGVSSRKRLIVVDDCAITGLRFGQWMRRQEPGQVVFAHLYSHPELRAAIEAREPSVIACLGARHLSDHAPVRLGEGYGAWRAERLGRDPGRYWVGEVNRICFPWSEPERAIRNRVTGELERAWSTAPARHLLRNRPGVGISAIPVQVQPEPAGAYGIAPHILFADTAEGIVLLDVDSERSITLGDVAAEMWRAVIQHPTFASSLTSLREQYTVDAATLERDLRGFIGELLHRGVLESRPHAERLAV